MTLIKSISGIRGTIGGAQAENLTPIDVVKFTTAYARLIKAKNPNKRITIVVGRDARISGGMVDSLVEGTLLGCGADVIIGYAISVGFGACYDHMSRWVSEQCRGGLARIWSARLVGLPEWRGVDYRSAV